MKSFGPKEFRISCKKKSAILAIFRKGPGRLCPDIFALKNPSQDLKNYFCFGFLVMLEGKIRETLFNAQSGKIKVWQMFESTATFPCKSVNKTVAF
jgi:hypothetical protein